MVLSRPRRWKRHDERCGLLPDAGKGTINANRQGHVKCESPRHPVGMDAGRPLLTPWAKDENPFDALRN